MSDMQLTTNVNLIKKKYLEKARGLGETKKSIYIQYISDVFERISNADSLKEYYNQTLKALKEIDKPLNDICIDDIQEYLYPFAPSTRNKVVGLLAEIFDIAERNTINLKISSTEIKKLTVGKGESNKVNPGVPLSLIEVSKLRNALIQNKMIRYLLTFELVYCYGLSERELALCNDESIDPKCRSFLINDKTILIPEYLQPMINENFDEIFLLHRRKGLKSFKTHINKAGKQIGLNLTIQDVQATRKEYSLVCSICNNSFPAEAPYWCVVRCISDNESLTSFPFICRTCKGRLSV